MSSQNRLIDFPCLRNFTQATNERIGRRTSFLCQIMSLNQQFRRSRRVRFAVIFFHNPTNVENMHITFVSRYAMSFSYVRFFILLSFCHNKDMIYIFLFPLSSFFFFFSLSFSTSPSFIIFAATF